MSQVIKAYIAQILGMVFMLLANMLLPVLIGFTHYGHYIYIFGFTYLVASLYNEGLDLLILEKRPLAKSIYRIASIKLYLTLFFVTLLAGYSLFADKVSWKIFILIYIQTFFYLIQSTLVVLGTLNKRNDLVIYSTINNGLFLFGVPLFFVLSGLTYFMPLAPLIISIESCVFTYYLYKCSLINFDFKLFFRYFFQFPSLKILYKHFMKQFIYSFNIIIFGVIVWFGVLYIHQEVSETFSSAFRFSMSIVGLLLGIIPFHRPTIFLLINDKKEDRSKEIKNVIITSMGILVIGYLFFIVLGELILKWILKDDYILIYNQLQLLYFVAPLKMLSDYFSFHFINANLLYVQIKYSFVFLFLSIIASYVFDFSIPVHFIHLVLFYYLFLVIGNIISFVLSKKTGKKLILKI